MTVECASTQRRVCQLCDCEERDFPHFEKYGLSSHRTVLFETDHFQAKPDVFPGNPDGLHVLVYPKRHEYNHVTLRPQADEIGYMLHEMKRVLGEDIVVFEHGGGSNQRESKIQSVYHAHFHVYGGVGNVDIIEYMHEMLSGRLERRIYPHKIISAPDEAFLVNAAQYFNGTPYLFVQQGTLGLWAPDEADDFSSQIAQRSMHRLFSGTDRLDWKQVGTNEEFAKLAIRRVLSLIQICKNGTHKAQ